MLLGPPAAAAVTTGAQGLVLTWTPLAGADTADGDSRVSPRLWPVAVATPDTAAMLASVSVLGGADPTVS